MLHLFSPLLGAPPRAATAGRSDTASTVGPPDKPDEQSWVYGVAGTTLPTDEDQKPTWGAFGEACDQGQSQSPIDICTSTVQPIANSSLRLHLHDYASLLPMNSGHNYELKTDDSSEEIFTEVEGEQMRFVQVHWHAPSENTIDGSYAAMEAHFVHQGPTEEDLAVVAVRYNIAERCNPSLEAFWDRFPSAEGDAEAAVPTVPLGAMLSPALLAGGYYRWNGSLTTPPCTEGVRWFLLKREEPAQVQRLRQTLLGMQGVNYNNRAVQPLHGRPVLSAPALR